MRTTAALWVLLGLGCDVSGDAEGPGGRRPRWDTADPAGDTSDTYDTYDTSDTSGDSGADTAVDGLACGDGRVGGPHEECDGSDDSACAGRCATTCQCPSAEASGVLQVDMIDVWQGDGLLITSPAGFTMLVDAGDESAYPGVRRWLLDHAPGGVDYTLVSHQHADHMGAMDRVLQDHPEVGLAWDGGGVATSDSYDDYVLAAGNRRTTIVAGQTLDLGPDLLVEVLHSDVGSTENENYNSVVIKLTYGSVRTLMGGDCETEGCERYFDAGGVDIYKVHHHGSSDSSGGRILVDMQPRLALISAGEGNDYGHPDKVTLDTLDQVGADVWRTDEDGSVRVAIDGATWLVEAEKR
ncbi:hypothetical protein LBMAG42_50200 [Deltaproteobacteria bacterium]|nr:hypothetical protein LBMAG42_50200 [Deltaproteobacteria bacterium]